MTDPSVKGRAVPLMSREEQCDQVMQKTLFPGAALNFREEGKFSRT